MGHATGHSPVLLFLAAFSRHHTALDWALSRAEKSWGPLALTSERFCFDQTDYYETTMGTGLRKCLCAVSALIDPARLPEIKLQTNTWEAEYAAEHAHTEVRPLNLDPGYVTLAKLVLATTKDRDHRIYVGQGIYAEGTLYYRSGGWQRRQWTYPDYDTPGYHAFLEQCRNYLRQTLKDARPP